MKHDVYTRFYLWLFAHRPLVFGLTAFLTLICLFLSTRINLEEDIMAMLPQHDQLVDDYRYTLRKLRHIDRVFIDIGSTNTDSEILAHAADELYESLATNADFVRITYKVEMTGQRKVLDFLTGALPNLFTAEDAGALEAKLDPKSIREYLTVMRRKLACSE